MAAIAATAVILPVGQAEVQPGTSITYSKRWKTNGILVISVNPDACVTNGSLQWTVSLAMVLSVRCVSVLETRIDAGEDHNTIRHEAIHAIQHCVNVARGTNYDTPIITDPRSFYTFVNENLSPSEQEWVTQMYDESQHLTELEAFAGAKAYTSAELEEMFIDACTLQEPFADA